MVLGQDSDSIYFHAYRRCSRSHIHSRFNVIKLVERFERQGSSINYIRSSFSTNLSHDSCDLKRHMLQFIYQFLIKFNI